MFDGLKDMGKLMKQAKDMKSQMKKVQDELKRAIVEADALNGMIKVVMTGELEVRELTIDPSLLDPSQKKNLEKGLIKAYNDAAYKSKQLASTQLSAISGGIPGLDKLGL